MIIGALAMAFAIVVSFLLSTRGLTFTPAAAGQALIEILPGWVSVPLIGLLHEWAKRLLVIGLVGVFLVAGALTGRLAVEAHRSGRLIAALGVAPWLLSWLAGITLTAQADPAITLVNAAASCAVFLAALAGLGSTAGMASAPGRRRLLYGIAAAASVIAAGGALLGNTVRAATNRVSDLPAVARRLTFRVTLPPEDPEIAKIAGLVPRVTPNEDHYTVDEALIKPYVGPSTWRLDVTGHVENPFSLSHEELLDLDAVEQIHTLQCISNPVGGPLISTALWTGVRLADLLERAKPRSGAFDVVLRSFDDYADSVPLAKAMEPGTVLAYLMNGRTLPQEHGFPLRALIPNIYGMKNVKWLAQIEVVPFDYRGYWMERGWSDVAVVNTNARVDVPNRHRTLKSAGRDTVVAGIAFAGSRGISRVEVSFDGRRTWSAAALEEAAGPLTWRRWAIHWTPPATGRHTITVRATDGTGRTETATRRDTFPDGATGHDEIVIQVEN